MLEFEVLQSHKVHPEGPPIDGPGGQVSESQARNPGMWALHLGVPSPGGCMLLMATCGQPVHTQLITGGPASQGSGQEPRAMLLQGGSAGEELEPTLTLTLGETAAGWFPSDPKGRQECEAGAALSGMVWRIRRAAPGMYASLPGTK